MNLSSQFANLTHEQAGRYLTFLWGGMMVGRFVGSAIMQRIDAAKVLAAFSIGAFIVMLVTVFAHGPVAMWSLILVGLFHSIMFPTIFSMAVHRLGAQTAQGSGLLCMAIVGGALLPLVQGHAADVIGLQASFGVPALCYAGIATYGWLNAGLFD